MRIVVLAFVAVVSVLISPAVGEDWDQFRGASAGKLVSVSHPMEWSAEENIAWSVPLEGSGWSSPIIVGDRIFLTSAVPEDGSKPKGMMAGVASMRDFRNAKPVNHQFKVSCFQLDNGELLWSKSVGEKVPPVVHPSNTYATESPATDGERLITFFATTGTLTAWDFEGNELWRKELGAYASGNGFGTGSSLAIANGRVFVQYDNDESSFVAAYDCETGAEVWRDDRETKTSWSTPLIWNNSKQQELVTCGSDVVTSYRPADGSVIWQLSGMQSAFSGSPAVDADRIYFGNSGPMSAGPLVAVAAGTEGEVELDSNFESDKVAWSRTKSGPGMASPVVAQGCIYIPGRGVLNCYDAASGERLYRERMPNMATVAASLWADEDRVLLLDENGTTYVVQAGREFKLWGTNTIEDLFWSTPAVAGDSLVLRGVEKMYCVRK